MKKYASKIEVIENLNPLKTYEGRMRVGTHVLSLNSALAGMQAGEEVYFLCSPSMDGSQLMGTDIALVGPPAEA